MALPPNIMKKFYRDFTERETELIDALQDVMADCYVFIPPFVVQRMVDRGILKLPDGLELIDENGEFVKQNVYALNDIPEYKFVESVVSSGFAYEFSNEGIHNPVGPYRVVWVDEYDGFTYFVKTSVPPMRNSVRVVDVWRKSGPIPLSPLASQRNIFARGAKWDISMILSMILDVARAQMAMKGA